MTKKQQLYYLIESFLIGQYDTKDFCEEYETIFFPDIPRDELTASELEIFEELGKIVVRFSSHLDDLRNYPNVYKNDMDIKCAANTAYKRLVAIREISANQMLI